MSESVSVSQKLCSSLSHQLLVYFLPPPAPIICAVFFKIQLVLAFLMDLMVVKRNFFLRSYICGINQQMVGVFNCMSSKFSEELQALKSAYELISVVGDAR